MCNRCCNQASKEFHVPHRVPFRGRAKETEMECVVVLQTRQRTIFSFYFFFFGLNLAEESVHVTLYKVNGILIQMFSVVFTWFFFLSISFSPRLFFPSSPDRVLTDKTTTNSSQAVGFFLSHSTCDWRERVSKKKTIFNYYLSTSLI